MAGLTVGFMVLGSFIGCYNMVSGSDDWCEPVIAFLGL